MGAPPTELKKGLKQRHLTMIAMGGVIGAGLFVGSGAVIGSVGPGAFLTYALTGVVIIMVMRMLGEMAVANPSTGSFADYSRSALGGWAGFSVAWLYWYFWVIVVGFEAIAGGRALTFWFPSVPVWVFALVLMALMTATNLFSVKSFGEFEFWFAGIKVAAIVVFLVLGALFVLGVWPHKSLDFSNLTAHSGFFPNGSVAVLSGVVVVIFSMCGAEIAMIAAAESPNPGKAIAQATNSIIMRIAVFFVLSIFLIACILPWNDAKAMENPYVSAFQAMGIPFADHIMNAIVLTAVLSCLNSGLYTSSRMLFVLAARREAPVGLMKVGKTGVPRNAILFSSIVGFICVAASALWPNTVFFFLVNSSGAVILFVYLLIAISQIVLRRKTPPEKLTVKMRLFPVLSILVALAIAAVLVQMALNKDTASQLWLGLLSWAILLVVFFATKKFRDRTPATTASPAVAESGTAQRVLILANETVTGTELLDEVRRMDRAGHATYSICVPANPIDTGQAMHSGAVFIWERTVAAAQDRLDRTLAALHDEGLEAVGALGDSRPLHALDDAVAEFHPDRIVISTKPIDESAWLKFDVVDRAREKYAAIPITHIVVETAETELAAQP